MIKHVRYSNRSSCLWCCCLCLLPYATHLPTSAFSESPFSSLPPPSLVILRVSAHKNGGQRWGSNSKLICGAAGPLPAQQLPRGPRGSLSQLYMQMSLHLGNSVGMLGPGAYLCKSQGDSTEPATDTGGRISPPAQKPVGKTWQTWKTLSKWQEEEWGDKAGEIGECRAYGKRNVWIWVSF